MPSSRIPGCIHCRQRHLRCDRASPACTNCRRAKPPKECVFGGVTIRHSFYSTKSRDEHKAKEATARPPRSSCEQQIMFQQPLDTNTGASFPSELATSPPGSSTNRSVSERHSKASRPPWSREHESPQGNASPESMLVQSLSPQAYRGTFEPREDSYTVRSPSLDRSALVAISPNVPFGHPRRPSAPRMVTDSVEQYVFDFYVSKAGTWLDIASSHRHMGQTVPRLALTEPVLYYACLAYASHVLFLKGKLDEYVHEQFQNKAIGLLIPLLSPHFTPAADKALLATTVILRMSEQFSELADDAQHHLNGAYSLFATTEEKWSPSHVDIRGVTFWIYLRESIRVCFLNEQGCQFNLDSVDEEFSTTSGPEEVWTNHMSYLLARLCNACWGDFDAEVKDSMRDRIQISMEEWRSRLPETFQPWCFSRKDYQPFPIMKFLSHWHEIAWQQYYTAKVMLAVYSSKQRDKSSVLTWNQYLEAEVISPARLACSLCFSSEDIGCNINGTHLIAWCGQFFTGREEQRLLANFLKEFMDKTQWPNRTCYERLEQIWKGSRRSWTDV